MVFRLVIIQNQQGNHAQRDHDHRPVEPSLQAIAQSEISDHPSQPRQPDAFARAGVAGAHPQRREQTVGQMLLPARILGDDMQQGYRGNQKHRPKQGQAAVASRQEGANIRPCEKCMDFTRQQKEHRDRRHKHRQRRVAIESPAQTSRHRAKSAASPFRTLRNRRILDGRRRIQSRPKWPNTCSSALLIKGVLPSFR